MRAAGGSCSRVARLVVPAIMLSGCSSTVFTADGAGGQGGLGAGGTGGAVEVCPDGPAASPSLEPLLHYALDADVRNAGSLGDGHDGIGAGETFGQGVLGGAIVLSAPAFLLLPNTAEVLREREALTIAVRFREPGATAFETPFFDCRTTSGGVQLFRRTSNTDMVSCWGADASLGLGACLPMPAVPGPWHHVLYERRSATGRVTVYLDGARQGALSMDGEDAFAAANDILMGTENVGDFAPDSTIALDDLRVYDQVIDDKCSEFGAPFCPCR